MRMEGQNPLPVGGVSGPEPVRASEREPILDVLRGFALLGILLVNIEYMRGADFYRKMAGDTLPAPDVADQVASFGIGWLAAGKFISSFAIMFGIGAALMAQRAAGSGGSGRRLLSRRYLLLLPLGLAHMILLFPGDILFVYGVTGLVLLAFIRKSAGAALRWSIGLFAMVVAASIAAASLMAQMPEPDADDPVAALMTDFVHDQADAAVTAHTAGTFADLAVANAWESLIIQVGQLITLPWILALFLLGFALGRAGVVRDLRAHRRQLRTAAWFGLGVGLPLNLVVGSLGPMAMGATLSPSDGTPMQAIVGTIGVTVGGPLLAIGYLAALALLCLRFGAYRPLALVGRMALTAYLLQSLLATLIFFGFGLYDGLTTTQSLVVVAGIWAVLLVVCPLWMRRFQFGPVEQLWRLGTYGRHPGRVGPRRG